MQTIQTILQTNAIHFHTNQGIVVTNVPDATAGLSLAEQLLTEMVDKKTALYLSGGRTPKTLYAQFARTEKLAPGAVAMIDERFGPKFHPKSNELMIRETGLLRYLEIRDIPFYPILQTSVIPATMPAGRQEAGIQGSGSPIGVGDDNGRRMTAELYDQKVRSLHATFAKSVGILGIGADGHTSSVIPNRKDFKNPMFDASQKTLLVSEFDDPKSAYGERIGMTFLGLSMLDLLVVLVFGEDKKTALEALFNEGSEESIPARFFKRPDIAKKTLFITDLAV